MQVPNPVQPSLNLYLSAARPATTVWQVGQVLQALVLDPAQQGRVGLVVGGTRLTAETQLPLQRGQPLTVQVAEGGDERILLRVLNRGGAGSEAQVQALRNALPRQTPLAPLMSNLAQQLSAPESKLPADARAAARELMQTLPTPREVSTAKGLEQALQRSGTFFESRVARSAQTGQPFPIQDVKAQLTRLLQRLQEVPIQPRLPEAPRPAPPSRSAQAPAPAVTRDAGSQGRTAPELPARADNRVRTTLELPTRADSPPLKGAPVRAQPATPPTLSLDMPLERLVTELRQQAAGALARVQLNQANSIPVEDDNRITWLVELALRSEPHPETVSLRIDREPDPEGRDGEHLWSVEVALDLPELGPVNARVALSGGRVSASFWAERPESAHLLERALDRLEESLEAAGLKVSHLAAFPGTPPAAPSDAGSGLPPLLSLKA